MDYKKSYEDALERAKCIYNENPSSSTAKFVCGQIFPEIKESEDERIRKWISDRLLANYSKEDDMVKEALVWLEKQKEQKQINNIIAKAFEKSKTDYPLEEREKASDYSEMVLPTSITCGEDEDEYRLHKVIEAAYIAGQQEQKPAEWSEEDTCILEDAITAVDLLGNDDEYSKTHPNLAKAFRVAKDWLKSLQERFNPQPKQEWSAEDEEILDAMIDMVSNSLYEPLCPREGMLTWLKSIRPHPAKSPLAEGVYYIKDGKPVAEYEDGVETDRLLIIGKYCRFYLSMADLGSATYEDAQNKAASLGEGWRCPDSFEGRTIGKMSDEIREKAAKIGAKHFKEKGWFWTNEVFDRWSACRVYFRNGTVNYNGMYRTFNVLALSAFQN